MKIESTLTLALVLILGMIVVIPVMTTAKTFQQREVKFVDRVPRKLYYPRVKKAFYTNTVVPLRVVLWTNENQLVAAKKDYEINITILPPGGREIKSVFHIASGQSEATYQFTPTRAGVHKIICRNEEMLPAEWVINILPNRTGYISPAGPPRFMLTSLQTQKAQIQVYTQDEKAFLADGKDFAEISFLLVDPDSTLKQVDSVKVILNNLNGKLSRRELYVNKIDLESSHLTSTTVGFVTVEIDCPNPRVVLNKKAKVIKFSAPIDHFELSFNPSQINLFDPGNVVINLKDKDSITIATDRIISGSLGIVSGNVRFENDDANVIVEVGRASGVVKFKPIASGQVTIHAELINLKDQKKDINVTWPWLLICLASGFGLVGSWGANKRKGTKPATILFGLVTGLALYWAVLFLLPVSISHANLLNPVSAVVIGTCGGFAGIEVLRVILKTIGVSV